MNLSVPLISFDVSFNSSTSHYKLHISLRGLGIIIKPERGRL
jgi:hypothetical protein